MKVSTDACIQGAWTPLPAGAFRVLDIGAGTGLLSLMIAQRQPYAMIDAIEIDAEAAAQAAENVAQSPFAQRIQVHHADARGFVSSHQYHLIICNPPFFKDSLHGPHSKRNAARHNIHLQQNDILEIAERHLASDGYLSLLWPTPEMEQWIQLSEEAGWEACASIEIKDRENTRVHRRLALFSRRCIPESEETLVIKNEEGYTEAFKQLLGPFYLHL